MQEFGMEFEIREERREGVTKIPRLRSSLRSRIFLVYLVDFFIYRKRGWLNNELKVCLATGIVLNDVVNLKVTLTVHASHGRLFRTRRPKSRPIKKNLFGNKNSSRRCRNVVVFFYLTIQALYGQ